MRAIGPTFTKLKSMHLMATFWSNPPRCLQSVDYYSQAKITLIYVNAVTSIHGGCIQTQGLFTKKKNLQHENGLCFSSCASILNILNKSHMSLNKCKNHLNR